MRDEEHERQRASVYNRWQRAREAAASDNVYYVYSREKASYPGTGGQREKHVTGDGPVVQLVLAPDDVYGWVPGEPGGWAFRRMGAGGPHVAHATPGMGGNVYASAEPQWWEAPATVPAWPSPWSTEGVWVVVPGDDPGLGLVMAPRGYQVRRAWCGGVEWRSDERCPRCDGAQWWVLRELTSVRHGFAQVDEHRECECGVNWSTGWGVR